MTEAPPAPSRNRPRTPSGTCRLVLTITLEKGRPATYVVRPLRPDRESGVIKTCELIKLGGQEGRYAIAWTAEGYSCSCPDFEFSRAGIDPHGCKHIRALVAANYL